MLFKPIIHLTKLSKLFKYQQIAVIKQQLAIHQQVNLYYHNT